jgi:hypothetical protein
VAHVSAVTLDKRPAGTTWASGEGRIFPLRPGVKDDRPYFVLMSLLKRSMVPYLPSPRTSATGRGAVVPSVVETPQGTLASTAEEGLRHSFRARLLANLEGAQRLVF